MKIAQFAERPVNDTRSVAKNGILLVALSKILIQVTELVLKSKKKKILLKV